MKKITWDKSNKKRLLLLLAVPVLIAVTAVFFQKLHAISCPFRTYCHFLCAGCGITRAFGALIKGHFIQSVMFNPLAIILALAGILFYAEQWCLFFGKKITLILRDKRVFITLAAVYGLYCILRNIPALSFISWA